MTFNKEAYWENLNAGRAGQDDGEVKQSLAKRLVDTLGFFVSKKKRPVEYEEAEKAKREEIAHSSNRKTDRANRFSGNKSQGEWSGSTVPGATGRQIRKSTHYPSKNPKETNKQRVITSRVRSGRYKFEDVKKAK